MEPRGSSEQSTRQELKAGTKKGESFAGEGQWTVGRATDDGEELRKAGEGREEDLVVDLVLELRKEFSLKN